MTTGGGNGAGGERYMRLFWKSHGLLNAFTPKERWAYITLLMHYVQQDDGLPDDDHLLATLAALPMKEWLKLREGLLVRGIARIVDGRWIDPDQSNNVDCQRRASIAQSDRANKRWGRLKEIRRAS